MTVPEHTCTFPTDPLTGLIGTDAVCSVCGRSVLSGYLLDLFTDDPSGMPDQE